MNISLSIIVPAFNEEGSLRTVVEQIHRLAQKNVPGFEILIVDDGSRDHTFAIAEDLKKYYPNVSVIRHDRNLGSGSAIRTGIQNSRGELVTYIPADGQFHLPELNDFLAAMENSDIVIGARIKRSDYTWLRQLSSRVFILLVNFLFHQSFKDVNWVHMWRKKIFEKVQPKSRGVFLLEEILVRARRAGYQIKEIDSLYIPRLSGEAKGSNWKTIVKTIFEMALFRLEISFPGRKL